MHNTQCPQALQHPKGHFIRYSKLGIVWPTSKKASPQELL